MKRVSVTAAKNQLNRLLAEVEGGETVLVVNRGAPVARIEPCSSAAYASDEAAEELIRRGTADPPSSAFDVETFLATPGPSLAPGVSASRLIAAERAADR